jgi:hypothetical protein
MDGLLTEQRQAAPTTQSPADRERQGVVAAPGRVTRPMLDVRNKSSEMIRLTSVVIEKMVYRGGCDLAQTKLQPLHV